MFVVVMGVSGSGKSTVARGLATALGVPVLDADELHPPANVTKMAGGEALTDDDRGPWLDAVGTRAAALAADDGGVVVACSALRRSYRDVLRQHGAARFLHLVGDDATIGARMGTREGHFMAAAMLASQLAVLEPTDDEPDVAALDVSATPDSIIADAARWLQG